MRVKAFVFPIGYIVEPIEVALPIELTPYSIALSLEDFATAFWRIETWRITGSITYRTTNGVSWGAWQAYNFSFVLDSDDINTYLSQEQIRIIDQPGFSRTRFSGNTEDDLGGTGPSVGASLQWGRDGFTSFYWTGDHGSISGEVLCAFKVSIIFNQLALGTNQTIYVNSDYAFPGIDTEVLGITFQGQTFQVFVNSEDDVTIPGVAEISDVTATISPETYLTYSKPNGTEPVWDSTTGNANINPYET